VNNTNWYRQLIKLLKIYRYFIKFDLKFKMNILYHKYLSWLQVHFTACAKSWKKWRLSILSLRRHTCSGDTSPRSDCCYLVFRRLGAILLRILLHPGHWIEQERYLLLDSDVIHRRTEEERLGKLTSCLSCRSLVRHISRGSSDRVCPRIRDVDRPQTVVINVNFIRLLSIQVFHQRFSIHHDQMVAANRGMYWMSHGPCLEYLGLNKKFFS